jgi:enterobactin synthetase component D / holo-[acyl-carrier protein] synthase
MINIHGLPSSIKLITADTRKYEFESTEDVDNYYPNASDKRKKEFLLGRLCARDALSKIGLINCKVRVGDNREPLWPSGIVGSITHCDDLCAAAVARSNDYLSLGIDIEPIGELPIEIIDLILTHNDKNFFKHFSPTSRDLKLIFCAKEAVYKCLYPLVHRFIDFLEVDVRLVKDCQQFEAYLPGNLARKVGIDLLQGYLHRSESHIFAIVFIRRNKVECIIS